MDHPLLLSCPYPLITNDGILLDGLLLPQTAKCLKTCPHRECATYLPADEPQSIKYHTCPFGYSVAVASVDDLVFRINGVVEQTTSRAAPDFKKRHRDRKIKPPVLQAWLARASDVRTIIDHQIDDLARESIHAFHDIKSLIGAILQAAEQWVAEQPGDTFDDKVDKADTTFRKIYHSCRILETLLQMTDIIANPDAATFGQPRSTSVHKVLFMLVKVHEDKAAKRKVALLLKGASINSVRQYNSFIVLPLVLLDNAIKHGDPNTKIHITVNDEPNGGVAFEISSIGTLVPPDERQKIFDRGYRGTNARAPGTGLGLFIANRVASANQIALSYLPKCFQRSPDRGYNCFRCHVPSALDA